MLCIGHRGAMGYEPENTLLSIRKALELGVDAVEIDVYNAEGKLVVIHDRDLSRTTNGNGYIEDAAFAYLRSLDAGKGEQIPTLEEVFDTVNRRAMVNIELKGSNTALLAANLILEYIERGWSYDDFVVSSFNHYELNMVRAVEPRLKLGMLIYGLPWQYIKIAQELSADLVIGNLDYVDANFVTTVHQQNLQAWVYTVDLLQDIINMRELGVDGIFTNYPDLLQMANN